MVVKKTLFLLVLGCTLVGCGISEEMMDDALTAQNELLGNITKEEPPRQSSNSSDLSTTQIHLDDPLENKSLASMDTLENNEINDTIDSELLDLTNLNPTMLYSQVYEMIYNHTEYAGQKIKLNGLYQEFSYENEEGINVTNRRIMIPDAAACCETGMELRWENLPESLPSFDEEIQIIGTYETYVEGYVLHCIIHVESMIRI